MNPVPAEPDAAGMAALLQRQRDAFRAAGAPTLAQRRADLRKLKALVLSHRPAIEAALQQDFGHRSPHETVIMEILPVVQAINHAHRHLRRWMRPERRHVPLHFQPGRAWVGYQPLGVVGIMAPWNYPLQLALLPLATAMAAGNRALLKPSEFTPATSALLQRMLGQGFAEEQVAVVLGDAEVGRAFSALPFDHLLFTGSTPVGRAVMKAASDHLVPVTLELGGKSPALIQPGHPMAQAAAAIAYGKLANGGQTCIAPDYVLVPQGEVEAFASAYDTAVRALYPAGPTSANYTSVANPRHHQRLLGLLDDARARQAKVVEVGVNPGAASQRAHNLPPTLVLNTTDDMAIMREEVFGPLLPVVAYQGLDEAIAYINARPRPLALYFFGDGPGRSQVLARTTSGNATVNNTLLHYVQDDLPFGGIGPSGMGAYHGVDGFKTLSHAKGVFQQGRWNLSNLLRPPFGPLADAVLKVMLR
ncbi:MAG: coniferyl aldehyde dehydrogenase [Proteobacteria bacterium]|nr:coniferyl aldehyde dehydrogenase [Pseudomonadota bacterium]